MSDPLDEFAYRDAVQAALESRCIICDNCDYPIMDTYYYAIFGKCVCPDCMKEALTFMEEE